jgi:hypothetical protein
LADEHLAEALFTNITNNLSNNPSSVNLNDYNENSTDYAWAKILTDIDFTDLTYTDDNKT